MAASRNVGMISWNKRRVLQARANLNGGELDEGLKSDQKRGGKMLRCQDVEDRPRTSLNGGELVRSTFVVLAFARALAFIASFILVLVFAFLSPFRSKILAFLWCNGEKRGIWIQC